MLIDVNEEEWMADKDKYNKEYLLEIKKDWEKSLKSATLQRDHSRKQTMKDKYVPYIEKAANNISKCNILIEKLT